MFKPEKIDDKIILIRFIIGAVYGVVAYIMYRFNMILFVDLSATIWSLAGAVFLASVFYIRLKYRVDSLFKLFIRGLLTFYGTWIIVFLILYDLVG